MLKNSFFYFTAFMILLSACSSKPALKTETQPEKQQQALNEQKEKAQEVKKEEPVVLQKETNNTEFKPQEEKIMAKENEEVLPQETEIQTISKKQVEAKKILFSATLFPFFNERGEVPFKIKVKIEKLLPKIKDFLKKNPGSVVVVKGYASIKGSRDFNQKLSFWRAKETSAYLAWKGGISKNKIKVYGEGVTQGNAAKTKKVEIWVME